MTAFITSAKSKILAGLSKALHVKLELYAFKIAAHCQHYEILSSTKHACEASS